MSRRTLTLLVAAAVLALLAWGGAVLPVPYVALGPGPVSDTLGPAPGGSQPLISVSGHPTHPTVGHLFLVTVSVVGDPQHEPTLYTAIGDWLSSSTAVVPEQLIYAPGENNQQVQEIDAVQMLQSQQDAITAALRYLHIPVHTDVAVGAVSPGTPAARVLRSGDVILAIDGTPVPTQTALRKVITAHPPGSQLTISLRRGSRRLTVTTRTVATGSGSARHAILGFLPYPHAEYPFHISIDLSNVGGPSAGMMFALGIIDKLTSGHLTGGRSIAGTGTIDPAGTVGPIGGVQQKVIAAARAGATVFLVPAGDCAGARQTVPPGVRLVKVSTLAGAVAALQNLAAAPSC